MPPRQSPDPQPADPESVDETPAADPNAPSVPNVVTAGPPDAPDDATEA